MVVAVVIISSGQQVFGDHGTGTVTLSTGAPNPTNLDPIPTGLVQIPFTVIFSDPTHELLHEDIAVELNSLNRRDNTASTPTSVPSYIGTFNVRGSGDGQFDYPRSIVVHDNQIYVADSNNRRIQVFDDFGNYVSQFGNEGQNKLGSPQGIAIDGSNIYVTDATNHRIQIYDLDGNFVRQLGSGPGNGNGTFNSPQGITVNGTHIFVVDTNNYRIQIFEKSGTYVDKFGQPGQGDHQFQRPGAIAINSTGNIFVADFADDQIKIFSKTGKHLASFDADLDGPSAIAIHGDDIYVASQINGKVIQFDQQSNGKYTQVLKLFTILQNIR